MTELIESEVHCYTWENRTGRQSGTLPGHVHSIGQASACPIEFEVKINRLRVHNEI